MFRKSSLYTDRGTIRIRWWVPALIGALSVLYLGYNAIVFLAVVSGNALGMTADPVLHAPIIWLTGQ